jgi:DUF917 family protein
VRLIGEAELDDIALGAGILGTGGGGDPYVGKLLAREAIRRHGPVQVVEVDDVDDDALIIPTAMMGAPTVMLEKLPRGTEVARAFERLEARLGRKATATMPVEVGGINSMIPFCVARRFDLPLVDADFMGRAFPEVQMCLPGIYGIDAAPMTVADDKGNVTTLDAVDNRWAERLARSHTIDMGCAALVAQYALTGAQLRQCSVVGSLRLAEDLGRDVREAREAHLDPVQAVLDRLGGFRVFEGKVLDVNRVTRQGFAHADVQLEGVGDDAGARARLRAQNEHLVAERDGAVLACVPDLIIVLDTDAGTPITTEELRYGLRVTVVVAPCDPRWRTERGLELVGPRYFGYDFDYVPIEERMAELAS